jgi:predicted HTH domain antitoxin
MTPQAVPLNKPRELIIFELYRRKRISDGKAAELLGVPKLEFLRRASELGIPYFDLDEQEFDREWESVGKLSDAGR